MIVLKSKTELSKMAVAGRAVAMVLDAIEKAVSPGVSTAELNEIAERVLADNGAEPAFKGYHGFPASICASVNDEVVHGIPGDRVLQEGDIVGVDVGSIVDGFYGDAARTFPVGKVGNEARRLLQVTEEALYAGIEQGIVGNRLSDISHAVQVYVEAAGYSVVRDFVGHGIGRHMHEEPQVPNFGPPGRGPRLREGMVLALEPMVNTGDYRVRVKEDNWTVVTADGSLSAHFEHSFAITDEGPCILTRL